MVARLLAVPAVLAVLAGGLVLGPVGPAAACSCVSDDPVELADHADVAFVGVLTGQRSDDDVVAHLFTVEDVLAGDVRRSQDVVTPQPARRPAASSGRAGPRWWCWATSTSTAGSPPTCAAARCRPALRRTTPRCEALGEPREPLPGRSMVALDPTDAQELLWSAAVVGVVGALGMVVVRRLTRRNR